MGQLNIHINEAFERDLKRFMELRDLSNKSEAVRIAIREGIAQTLKQRKTTDFKQWIGIGKPADGKINSRFTSDDALWEKG